jgi:hypothetical protein
MLLEELDWKGGGLPDNEKVARIILDDITEIFIYNYQSQFEYFDIHYVVDDEWTFFENLEALTAQAILFELTEGENETVRNNDTA